MAGVYLFGGQSTHGHRRAVVEFFLIIFVTNLYGEMLNLYDPWNLLMSFMLEQATGGGAFKFADLFKEKLGLTLDKVEEMESLVTGANFLLKVGFLL